MSYTVNVLPMECVECAKEKYLTSEAAKRAAEEEARRREEKEKEKQRAFQVYLDFLSKRLQDSILEVVGQGTNLEFFITRKAPETWGQDSKYSWFRDGVYWNGNDAAEAFHALAEAYVKAGYNVHDYYTYSPNYAKVARFKIDLWD